jgi:hypothetical protein
MGASMVTPVPPRVSSRSPWRNDLARQILLAVAPGSVLVAACGGHTIIDDGIDGSGGAASASATSASAATSGTGGTPFECSVPLPPNSDLVYQCVGAGPNDDCPSDAEVLEAFNAVHSGQCSDPASCWCWEQIGEGCGCYANVSTIPCGPDPNRPGECCYYGVRVVQGVCEGRPFTVDGEVRTAASAHRADWQVTPHGLPALGELSRDARRALARAWSQDALFEHASIASFARFVLELLALGAPADLVADAQRALGDEIVHAELCFGFAGAYAGEPVGPASLPMGGAVVRPELSAVAVATFVEGCVNETLAAVAVHAACDEARDPAVKVALARIADDESRHALLAWRFVAWACSRSRAAHQAVAEALAALRPESFGASVATEVDNLAMHDRQALQAHGQLGSIERQTIVAAAAADMVLPCARALLAATAHADAQALEASC